MRSEAPPLLPIFRSQHQAELMTLLLLHPDREYSLTELATTLRTPLTTVQREVGRLAETGVISERRVGRNRMVKANEQGRYTRPLTELMTVAFGPRVVIAEEFASVSGLDAVAIYGSWAARYSGHPGPPPNDVDVLAIGRPDRSQVYAAADRAEQRLGLPVNPMVCNRQRWTAGDDPFVRQLKSAPLVWALGAESFDEVA